MRTVGGDEVDAGCVHFNDGDVTVESVQPLGMRFREDGNTPDSTTVRLETVDGETWDLASSLKDMVQPRFGKREQLSALNQGFSDFTCDGGKGCGVHEHAAKVE